MSLLSSSVVFAPVLIGSCCSLPQQQIYPQPRVDLLPFGVRPHLVRTPKLPSSMRPTLATVCIYGGFVGTCFGAKNAKRRVSKWGAGGRWPNVPISRGNIPMSAMFFILSAGARPQHRQIWSRLGPTWPTGLALGQSGPEWPQNPRDKNNQYMLEGGRPTVFLGGHCGPKLASAPPMLVQLAGMSAHSQPEFRMAPLRMSGQPPCTSARPLETPRRPPGDAPNDWPARAPLNRQPPAPRSRGQSSRSARRTRHRSTSRA